MFRVMDIDLDGDGQLRTYEGEAALARVQRPPPGLIRWIDLVDQDAPQVDRLGAAFNFHPLALEDCLHQDQRPKVDEFAGELFIVVHGFECATEQVTALEPLELHNFLGHGFLITVHVAPIAALDEAWKRVAAEAALGRRGADFLFYLVVDGMADANFPIIDKVSEELEAVEETVMLDPRRTQLARIFALKHELAIMRRVLSPQRDLVNGLAKREGDLFSDKTQVYLRDVYDHLARISESIDANRDLLGNALDAYLSAVSNRTNEIMKYLTIMSAVFLPLTFLVGFFGQNFEDLPDAPGWMHSHHLMYFMMVSCVTLPVVMVLWFKHKKWL
jgi:magnesium transporter